VVRDGRRYTDSRRITFVGGRTVDVDFGDLASVRPAGGVGEGVAGRGPRPPAEMPPLPPRARPADPLAGTEVPPPPGAGKPPVRDEKGSPSRDVEEGRTGGGKPQPLPPPGGGTKEPAPGGKGKSSAPRRGKGTATEG
jgi:hypothetical protein